MPIFRFTIHNIFSYQIKIKSTFIMSDTEEDIFGNHSRNNRRMEKTFSADSYGENTEALDTMDLESQSLLVTPLSLAGALGAGGSGVGGRGVGGGADQSVIRGLKRTIDSLVTEVNLTRTEVCISILINHSLLGKF